MDIVLKYFPELSDNQKRQFAALYDLYFDWNTKINVISRKDFEHIYEKHILHSLAIAKFYKFPAGTKIMDVGTGGGFPGIPMAIMFPECNFTLIDSIAKKIKVVDAVASAIGLTNVRPIAMRAESVPEKFHYVVSRAVTTIPEMISFIKKSFSDENINPYIKNGLIYLKGGDIDAEIKDYKNRARVNEISEVFTEEFFETKKVIYIPAVAFAK